MPEDLYDDGPDQQAAATSRAEPAKGDEEKGSGETALINSSICPGMEVGEEIVLKIVGKTEGEYVVSYSPGPDKENESPPAKPAESDSRSGGEMFE